MPNIKGLNNHPNLRELKQYQFEAPEGTWNGRLDNLAWGKSTNLFCYFTDLATGDKRRLSVFSRSSYSPYREGPNFKNETPGNSYEITTGKSKKSNFPTFVNARKLG